MTRRDGDLPPIELRLLFYVGAAFTAIPFSVWSREILTLCISLVTHGKALLP